MILTFVAARQPCLPGLLAGEAAFDDNAFGIPAEPAGTYSVKLPFGPAAAALSRCQGG